MEKEIEAKFLHQDVGLLRVKLRSVGAELIHRMSEVARVNFDFDDFSLDKKRAWLRVRKNGDGSSTMTFKQKVSKDVDIHGVSEIEVTVSSYKDTIKILHAIGMKEKSVQHTKRELWKLDGCEIMIDIWPWVDPFVEVEGLHEDDVKKSALMLGLNWDDAQFGDVGPVYFDEYDITEDELYIKLKHFDFDMPIPAWLAAKKKM